ncbi:MAG: NAD(P)H-hydrate dehydratase [Bradyrhizobiaceae bacterium]|nr:NAD(P)H-hydrate dehydratase [Bradyrhizobiaceae bacterium]
MELLTNAEMAEADRLAIAGGAAGITLMENAGRAVADAVGARTPPGSTIAIVAGPGNNGGDGFVAGRLLAERGFTVRLALVGYREKLKGDAAEAASRFRGSIEPASARLLDGAGVVVDALFGAGLDRPVSAAAVDMIAAMNACGAPIIAVDLPSGINGTTGAVMGTAVRAAESVTFFRRKPGHLLLPGRLHCGRVDVADIGIPTQVLERLSPKTFLNRPTLWRTRFPVPRIEGHKYARGHAVVVSGGASHTGAARLAARAALRAGAGLVTIASPRDALAINAAASFAVMVRPVDGARELAGFLADRRLNALVLGPGGGVGQPMRDLVASGLAGPRAVVLDADALTSFEEHLDDLCAAIAARDHPVVLTPHAGEFARLFKSEPEVTGKASKIEMARAAATRTGAVVLLKGPDTVVAAPDGRAAVNDNAPAWLATAGAGDVLAGLIAGLLAQGMPGFEAAAAAAWVHGEAAARFGPGLIAEDLSEVVPAVYRALFAEISSTG